MGSKQHRNREGNWEEICLHYLPLYFEGEFRRQAMTQVPSMNEGLFTVVTETSATSRLQYEDDYEYESKVLSTRTSKILGLQA